MQSMVRMTQDRPIPCCTRSPPSTAKEPRDASRCPPLSASHGPPLTHTHNHTTPACTGGGPSSMLRPPCLALALHAQCSGKTAARNPAPCSTPANGPPQDSPSLLAFTMCVLRASSTSCCFCLLVVCPFASCRVTVAPSCSGANHTACPDRCCRPRRTPPPVSHHHSGILHTRHK